MNSLLLIAFVAAHVGQDQFGKIPFVDGGTLIGGATSWGLVRPDPEGGWSRVCEEAFGPVVFFAIDQGERVLMGGIEGLSTTTDHGCSYTVVQNELTGEFTSALWIDPTNASHLIVGTSTVSATNGLWESSDGGDTWTELLPARPANFFNLAASDDGVLLAASGNNGAGEVLLLVSDDGGASFIDVSDVANQYPVIHALLFDGSTLLLGGFESTGQGFVDRVAFDGVSATATRLGSTPRETTQAALFQGELYVIAKNGTRGELYRANESALGFGVVPEGPSECVFVKGDDLFGCGKQVGVNTSLFLRSDDGVIWREEVAFFDIHYEICPEGAAGRTFCSTFVELFCADGVDNDLGGGTDCADPDCETNEVCVGEGEGEGGEGEGDVVGEGEGEGVLPATSCCTGAPASVWLLGLGLRRRRR